MSNITVCHFNSTYDFFYTSASTTGIVQCISANVLHRTTDHMTGFLAKFIVSSFSR